MHHTQQPKRDTNTLRVPAPAQRRHHAPPTQRHSHRLAKRLKTRQTTFINVLKSQE
jgi:hypothetical protein